MKNIHYAFASVIYHKKTSLCIGACSAGFLLVSTGLLNLITMEKNLNAQISTAVHLDAYMNNYQKTLYAYLSLYAVVTLLYLLLAAIFIQHSIQTKQTDRLKWRITGFSNRFILKQSILETLIPIVIGAGVVIIFLLVFQHTYEFLLLQLRTFLTHVLGIQQNIVFSTNYIKETTPTSVSPILATNTYFLSLEVNQLSLLTILATLAKNSIVLITIAIALTVTIDAYYFNKFKYLFRM